MTGMTPSEDEITDGPQRWGAMDRAHRDQLVERLYPQLRRLVGHHLNRRSNEITLQTTELIHELYLQLLDQRKVRWEDHGHFFAIAGRLLRRIVVDHERHRQRQKRGGGQVEQPLENALNVSSPVPVAMADLVTLDQALVELETVDDRAARVVELRYFAGLSHDETAQALGVGRATVTRSWRFARAWLRNRLGDLPRNQLA